MTSAAHERRQRNLRFAAKAIGALGILSALLAAIA